MPRNIKKIGLWLDNPKAFNNVPIVRIDFNIPCTWTVLNIDDLKQILREWIKGEEMRYPPSEGFAGRQMLFKEILEVFYDTK